MRLLHGGSPLPQRRPPRLLRPFLRLPALALLLHAHKHLRRSYNSLLARAGNATACFELGVALQHGDGRAMDRSRARRLFEQAIDSAGHAGAMVMLGHMFHEKRPDNCDDVPLAVFWYLAAVKQGDARAMNNLAVMLEEGVDSVVTRDVATAMELYNLAVDGGNAEANYNLASVLCDNENDEEDLWRAAKLLRRAVRKGIVEAMFDLALLWDGRLCKPWRAGRLYERHFKETGSMKSMIKLAEILQVGTWWYPIDLERAAALFQHAAEQGDLLGMENYALLLLKGKNGVSRDVGEALKMYGRAAKSGDLKAINNLADVLEDGGEGELIADPVAAACLYEYTAGRGSGAGMYKLALLLVAGVETDGRAAMTDELLAEIVGPGEEDGVQGMGFGALRGSGQLVIAQDTARAMRLMMLAAEEKHYRDAVKWLGELFVEGADWVERDAVEAVRWFQIGARVWDGCGAWELEEFLREGGMGVTERIECVTTPVCGWKEAA